MSIDWEKIDRKNLFSEKLYAAIYNNREEEQNLYDRAKTLHTVTEVKQDYARFKKEKQLEDSMNSVIDFGDKAPVQKMVSPGYYKDKNLHIRTLDGKNTLVTATLIEPVAILKNQETGEELVKCAFLNRNKWQYFVINRETILHNGKITKLANKGIDVTSDSARLLVGFLRDLLYSNEIPEYVSTSKMGWFNGEFLPYDEQIEFDGEESFKDQFESLHVKGDFEVWREQVESDRQDNVPLKLFMATSFASPLLKLIHRQSFVTLLWGKSGGGKTAAGRIAMSIWGNNELGKLILSMNNTLNYYYRTAEFFNNLPVFYDELQTYHGDVNKLIMSLTEGIDRGKAAVEGGTQRMRYWNNTFLFTGEESASDINSGGGTLNRLIEIYVTKKVIKNGIKTCEILDENYGHAGKKFIDFLKTKSKEEINTLFKQKYDELMSFDKTEEKQAINMAMLLLADDLACQCVFKNEIPLKAEEVLKYMFTKKEIDNAERAYEVVLDECEINNNKFMDSTENRDNPNTIGEFWGMKDSYEITIISNKLRDILKKNGFNYNKAIKDWAEKGYVEKNSSGRYSTNLSKFGRKANYVIIKIKQEEN